MTPDTGGKESRAVCTVRFRGRFRGLGVHFRGLFGGVVVQIRGGSELET